MQGNATKTSAPAPPPVLYTCLYCNMSSSQEYEQPRPMAFAKSYGPLADATHQIRRPRPYEPFSALVATKNDMAKTRRRRGLPLHRAEGILVLRDGLAVLGFSCHGLVPDRPQRRQQPETTGKERNEVSVFVAVK